MNMNNAVNGAAGVLIANAFMLTPIQVNPGLCFFLSLCIGAITMGLGWRWE